MWYFAKQLSHQFVSLHSNTLVTHNYFRTCPKSLTPYTMKEFSGGTSKCAEIEIIRRSIETDRNHFVFISLDQNKKKKLLQCP